MQKTFALLSNRNFVFTWLSSIVESVGLAVLMLTTTWYVVDTLHMKSQLGMIIICGSVPRLLLMTAGGVLADRMAKIKIMTVTFWLRVVIVGAGALLFWGGAMSIPALIVSGMLFGVADAFFWPARDALLPSIVSEHEIVQANSIMQATGWICMTLAPMVGGALLSYLSFHGIYFLVTVLMAVGAILIALVKERPLQRGEPQHIFVDLREGIRYVFASPMLRILILIYIVANLLFMGPSGMGPPIIASEHLKMGPAGLSYMMSGFGLGMICGFLTMIIYPPRNKRMFLIVGILAVEGVLLSLIGHIYLLWPVVALQFLLGFCIACNNVPMMSLIQQYTDRDKLGRVMSFTSVSSMGLSPISFALVSALLSGGVPIGTIMPVFGITMTILVLTIGAYSATAAIAY
jgi:DHA3 family macrolide efflux protein-like MFS transporter